MLKTALQLYSVSDALGEDFSGRMKQLAGMGYDGVELAGTYSLTAAEMKKAADDACLEIISAHMPYADMTARPDFYVEYLSEIGAKQAVIPYIAREYLPGGDKEITTRTESTLCALQAALELLRVDGLLCVTVYWGHPSGREEREAVLRWAKNLDKGIYHCVHTDMLNQPNCPPEIVLITKKKEE